MIKASDKSPKRVFAVLNGSKVYKADKALCGKHPNVFGNGLTRNPDCAYVSTNSVHNLCMLLEHLEVVWGYEWNYEVV